MNRHARKQTAEETLKIVERGEYSPRPGSRVVIADDVAAAVAGTRVYTPSELANLLESGGKPQTAHTEFDVRNETTLSAARRLVVEQGLSNVLCLNFASAKNPGGGFLGGSQAQEESLARASALYETLIAAPTYYEVNRSCGTAIYTDHMILSPDVPVFRDDADQMLGQPYNVSILTAPAVNAGAVCRNERQRVSLITETMRRRIAMVLAVAARYNYRHLVLGAWGCGVFRNDPAQVAGLFAECLLGQGKYVKCFDKIVFAVLDRPDDDIIESFVRCFVSAEVA